jgi:hypothetical protein
MVPSRYRNPNHSGTGLRDGESWSISAAQLHDASVSLPTPILEGIGVQRTRFWGNPDF